MRRRSDGAFFVGGFDWGYGYIELILVYERSIYVFCYG
jgi:hypothetical protein